MTGPIHQIRVFGALLFAFAVCLSATSFAQVARTPTDGVRPPESGITSRDDPLSLELNPAGLAFIKGFEAQTVYTTLDNDLLAGWGLYLGYGGLGPFGLGTSIQYVDNPLLGGEFTKFTLGFAAAPTTLWSVGLGFNYFDSDTSLDVDEFSSWDFGLQLHLADFLGVGMTIRDFNTPRLGDVPLEPRYAMGAHLRFDEARYLFDIEGIYEQTTEDWFLRSRVSVEPLSGLRVFAEVETSPVDDFGLSLLSVGLAVSLGSLDITGASVVGLSDETSLAGASMSVRIASSPLRPIFEPSGIMASIELSGALPERGYSNILFGTQRSFLDLLVYFDDLAHDERVRGVVIEMGNMSLGFGQHWELRQALTRLRENGKLLVIHMANADFGDWYLASAADHIIAAPGQPFFPTGFSTTLTYFGELFENIGVDAEFVRIGEYKSAAESYSESRPSDYTLEATNAYLDDSFYHMVDAIADSRGFDRDAVIAAMDGGPYSAEEAVALGLVDATGFADELDTLVNELAGNTRIVPGYDPNYVRDYHWISPPTIAVVHVEGTIMAGRSGSLPLLGQTAGHNSIVRTLEYLTRSRRTRAIVLRIDSPGGTAWASEEIWRAVQQANEVKPVIISMGDIAASGGYYVAASGSEIFATPITLTGSIGIYSGHFATEGLQEMIGLHRFSLVRGANTNLLGFNERWTEDQRETAFRHISLMYDTFLERVAAGRGMTEEEVDTLGRGRIWSGTRALENGLIDEIGGLMDAINRAKELAGLADSEVTVVQLPERGLLGLVPFLGMRAQGSGADWSQFGTEDEQEVREMDDAFLMFLEVLGLGDTIRLPLLIGTGEPQYRMEFELSELE